MAHALKRTTILLSAEDERALHETSRVEGVSRSELIRRGIRAVTLSYRAKVPTTGWLALSPSEREAIAAEEFGDRDR